ncbi:SDR family oxidoreductase [Ruminococcaceae bacterium OttesenSCG-928-I18]|nr:SDR family oxidoreductase [Ruminococcaceae bacterium OttesenSCG-928-I18]
MKTVLVTGAASGLGKALTEMYLEKGYTVFGIDVDQKNLDAMSHKNLIPLLMDISKADKWDEVLVPAVEKEGKGLDIVIACASIMRLGSALDCSVEDWQFVNNINLTGQFLTAKKTLPYLKKNKGNILFIGSPSAKLAVRDEVCYITFKHALLGLSKSVAFDFGEDGVRSNVVHPGWMRTAMSDQEMEEIMERDNVDLEGAYDIACQYVPLKRPGSLEEICNGVDFLTSDKASYITGAELSVEGGITIVDPGMIPFL